MYFLCLKRSCHSVLNKCRGEVSCDNDIVDVEKVEQLCCTCWRNIVGTNERGIGGREREIRFWGGGSARMSRENSILSFCLSCLGEVVSQVFVSSDMRHSFSCLLTDSYTTWKKRIRSTKRWKSR